MCRGLHTIKTAREVLSKEVKHEAFPFLSQTPNLSQIFICCLIKKNEIIKFNFKPLAGIEPLISRLCNASSRCKA